MKVKEIETGTIYDVVDTYSSGYIIEKERNGYRYTGHFSREFDVIDDSPIEYIKSKQFLAPKITGYSKTIFIDEEHVSGEIEQAEDTIVVYQNVVVYYSPAKDQMMVLDIKKTERTGNKHVWGFERHEDDTISLSPSIRSTQHEHQEHYFIKRNKVVNWCGDSWETVYMKREELV